MTTKKPSPKKKLFTEEMAKIILDLGKQGASQKTMYSAINISKATAAKWKKEDPVFAEAMDLATTYGQAFWEMMLLANIDNKAFNSRVAEVALKGQYPEDYSQRMDIKQDIKQEVVIDFQGEISKLILALKE